MQCRILSELTSRPQDAANNTLMHLGESLEDAKGCEPAAVYYALINWRGVLAVKGCECARTAQSLQFHLP